MRLLKLIRYDFYNGILLQYKRYIPILLIGVVFTLDFFRQIIHSGDFSQITLGSCLFYFFQGMKEYIPKPDEPFIFPTVWMVIHIALSYLTMQYPHQNLFCEGGQNVLVRSGKRRNWWLAKCVWNVETICISYAILYGAAAVCCIVMETSLSLNISPEILHNFFELEDSMFSNCLFALPLVISMAMTLLQMFLSLFIKPLYSFIGIVSIYLASAYWASPFWIGNYAMYERNVLFNNGTNSKTGIIVSIVIAVLSIILGSLIFQYYDILEQE